MTQKTQSLALVTLFLLFLIKIEGNSEPKAELEDVTAVSAAAQPWPNAAVTQRLPGCRNMPWICSEGEFPPRSVCCNDRCVDLATDRNNCGMCGLSCILNWQCCNRFCLNTNLNPLNCGKCGVICPFGRICIFGICAFAQSATTVTPVTPPEENSTAPLSQPPAVE